MKRLVILVVICLLTIPSTVLSQSKKGKSKSNVNKTCTTMADLGEKCFMRIYTVGDVQTLGMKVGMNTTEAYTLGELCQMANDAREKGWTKDFTRKYIYEQCYRLY